MVNTRDIKVIDWLAEGRLRLLDQTALPRAERYVELPDERAVADAIRGMVVRGAPAIGIAGAYGLALAAYRTPQAATRDEALGRLRAARDELASSRPTAANLGWALDRVLGAAAAANNAASIARATLDEARRIHREQTEADERMGQLGAALLPDEATVLTHCNTGALATGGRGTALGVVRAAWEQGKRLRVLADETRPRLQGARLTAWELRKLGIPCTVIADGAAGHFLRSGRVDAALVGADRIAANGDVANKVGTYMIALAARAAGVPFYVVAPVSTLDLSTPDGGAIPIEERDPAEVITIDGARGVEAANPAFDVTPADLVTAIVTDRDVARPPYAASLEHLAAAAPVGGRAG